MPATESSADALVGSGRVAVAEVHRELTRPQHVAPPGRRRQRLGGHPEELGDEAHHTLDAKRLLRGLGGGEFAEAESIEVGDGPHAMALADYNEDTWPDLAFAVGDEATMRVLFSGEAGFTSASFAAGLVPRAIVAGDFNNDGNADTAVANQDSENIMIFEGDGQGGFTAGTTIDLGIAPEQLYAAHFNDDGNLDLAMVAINFDTFSGELTVFLADGNGGFELSPFFFSLNGTMVVGIEDFDLDGVTDLALGSNFEVELNLLPGRGDGTFLSRTVLESGERPRSVAAADVNASGRLDLVSANSQGGNLSFFAAQEDGTYVREDLAGQGASFHSVVTADLDGNAAMDLAAVDFAGGGVQVFLGTVGGIPQFSNSQSTGLLPVQVLAGAFLGNDAVDLAVLHEGASNIAFLEGAGDGTFAPPVRAAVSTAPSRFATGQFDSDGNADFVVAGKQSLTVYFSDGSGVLPRSTPLVTTSDDMAVAVGDVDVDGFQDIVVAEFEGNVSLYYGAAGGTFSDPQALTIENQPASVTVADLNGDGPLEILVGQQGSASVQVVLGEGNRSFRLLSSYRVGDPNWIITADLDGDSALDAVTADFFTDTLSILFGRLGTPTEQFRRGDVDGNVAINLTDAVVTLGHLFQGTGPLDCDDAADIDDDGQLNLTDVILLLGYLFQAGEPPRPPGPESCGADPTPDDLGPCVYTNC